MRILLVNTYHYNRGGASVYTLNLADLLRSKGHEIYHFAMKHPQSLPCPETEEYWPENIEYPELLKRKTPRNICRVLRRTINNAEAAEGIRGLIEEKGPFDIAHLNNILHHITPSILDPLNKAKIPIVWTLHDYSLICPNTNFINNRTGELCSKCIKGGLSFIHAPLSRCKKGSFAASLMAAIEAWIHRLKKVTGNVDKFISPSAFLMERFMEAGFDGDKFEVLPCFVWFGEERTKVKPSNYALYAGRLSPEKGIVDLIKAWKEIQEDIILKIAGSGPLLDSVQRAANESPNIQYLGFVEPDKLREIRRKGIFTITPSICWDNLPIAVMESLSDGIPVLGANIGGIPEMIENEVTGLLFKPGDIYDLRDKALRLFDNNDFASQLGQNARKVAQEKYSPQNHLMKLMAIYRNLISN